MNVANPILITRIKALLWGSGMMAIAFFLDALLVGLAGLDMPEYATVVLGLTLAQLSKHFNNVAQGKYAKAKSKKRTKK